MSSGVTVADEGDSFLFFCDLDQMEGCDMFWERSGTRYEDYPKSEYSFAQFLESVSQPYREYLENYAEIRDHVVHTIPSTGQPFHRRELLWVVFPRLCEASMHQSSKNRWVGRPSSRADVTSDVMGEEHSGGGCPTPWGG